jgi:hypothetical protein
MIINSLDLMDILHCMSGRPNHVVTTNGPYPALHPPLHLFDYILRKHFEYRLDDKAFEFASGESVYERFIRHRMIFTASGDWDGLLSSSRIPQDYVFQEIPYSDCWE